MVCNDFGINENKEKYLLNRADALEEPAFPLRREAQELTKANVSSGDLLILTNIQEGIS